MIQACSGGSYGKDCTYRCSGNCWNWEPCNPVDGRCAQCMAGWENEFCNKSKFSIQSILYHAYI